MRTARSSSRRGGVCLSACWDRPPPRCGPGDPPDQIPLNFPLGCGPGDPPWPDSPQLPPWVWAWRPPWPDPPQLPPWVWAWKSARHAGMPPPQDLLQGMLGYHLQCMLGYHPPCEQNDWQTPVKTQPSQTLFAAVKMDWQCVLMWRTRKDYVYHLYCDLVMDQGSDCIAILFIFDCEVYMTKFENLKHWYLYSTKDLDLGNAPEEISQWKILLCKILPTLPFWYFHCRRFVLNIFGKISRWKKIILYQMQISDFCYSKKKI